MTAEADRAQALTAAIQDIARDLEADLGKLTRYRGTSNPSHSGMTFKDPGPDVAAYAAQKKAVGERATLRQYHALAQGARDAFNGKADSWGVGGGVALTGATKPELNALITAIESVRTHDDAVALVATFEVI